MKKTYMEKKIMRQAVSLEHLNGIMHVMQAEFEARIAQLEEQHQNAVNQLRVQGMALASIAPAKGFNIGPGMFTNG